MVTWHQSGFTIYNVLRAGSRIAKGEGHKCSFAAEMGVESVYHAHFCRGDCANKLSIYDNCIVSRLQYSYSDCKYNYCSRKYQRRVNS